MMTIKRPLSSTQNSHKRRMIHTVCSFNVFLDRKIVRRPSILGLGFQGFFSKALSPSITAALLIPLLQPSDLLWLSFLFPPHLLLLNVLFLVSCSPSPHRFFPLSVFLPICIGKMPLPRHSFFVFPSS